MIRRVLGNLSDLFLGWFKKICTLDGALSYLANTLSPIKLAVQSTPHSGKIRYSKH
jgi:hypothetical protein